ncbi:MAG: ABC transporter permease [Acidobacteriota bacterium]|jgi:ABC-2 type transport system permease protein|nr:ABC transporter permease [Acidobacteriota bacterium]
MGRIKAIIVKEFFHILRDPRSLTMVFITPLVMIFILGYSVSYDLNRIDAAVIDLDQSPLSKRLAQAFAANRVFVVHNRGDAPGRMLSLGEAEEMLRRREIKEIIVIPADLSRRLAARGSCEIGLIIDGSETNVANLVYQYDERILLEFNSGLLAAGGTAGRLLRLDTKIYFNPEVRSQFFFIPGLVAVILLMISAMLTSLSISRERETGSIALLFISPLRSREIIIGKTIPYIIVALLDGVFILLFARFWFGIPLRGSLLVLLLFALLYILSGLALGILISTSAPTQRTAMLATLLITMLPSFLLSGFIFPLDSLSPVLRAISYAVPATYFLRIIRGVILKGAELKHFLFEGGMLVALSLVLLAAATRKFNRQRKAAQ